VDVGEAQREAIPIVQRSRGNQNRVRIPSGADTILRRGA